MRLSLLLSFALALPCAGICDPKKDFISVDIMVYKFENNKKLLLGAEESETQTQFPGGFSLERCPDKPADDAEDKTMGTCREGFTCCPLTSVRRNPDDCDQKMEGSNCKLEDICVMKEAEARKKALGQMLDPESVDGAASMPPLESYGRIIHHFRSASDGTLGSNDMLVLAVDVANFKVLDEFKLPGKEAALKPVWFPCDKKMMDQAHRIKSGKQGDFDWMEKNGNFYHADLFTVGDIAKKFNCPVKSGGAGKVILVIFLILIVVIGVGALVYIQSQKKPLMPPTSGALLEQEARSIELATK